MPDTDSILVLNGIAWEIWRGKSKAQLPPFHPDLVAMIVEAPAGTVHDGYRYTDGVFTPPSEED